MGFYEELSKYYDIVFPLGQKQMDFIMKRIKPGAKVLDVAAGTGNYSLALGKEGYDVTAIDLDEEMVANIIEKGNVMNINVDAKVLNMLDIDSIEEEFDGIVCIGNSLVHLKDENEILKCLRAMKSLLNDNGDLIIQIVNYDRVIVNDVKSLPIIDRPEEDVKFVRDYVHEDGSILFNTTLVVGEKEYKNSIPLYPLKSKDLERLLIESGFKEISFYGGFNECIYEQAYSFPLVVSAR